MSPDDIRRVAADVRAAGRQTADDQALLRSYGSMFSQWMSPAADQFNSHQFQSSLSNYDMVERDAEDVARTLEQVANQLEETLRVIRRTAGNVHGFFASPPLWAQGTAEDPNPVWVRVPWRYQPYNLPAPDSPDWLVVGSHFRNVYGVSV